MEDVSESGLDSLHQLYIALLLRDTIIWLCRLCIRHLVLRLAEKPLRRVWRYLQQPRLGYHRLHWQCVSTFGFPIYSQAAADWALVPNKAS